MKKLSFLMTILILALALAMPVFAFEIAGTREDELIDLRGIEEIWDNYDEQGRIVDSWMIREKKNTLYSHYQYAPDGSILEETHTIISEGGITEASLAWHHTYEYDDKGRLVRAETSLELDPSFLEIFSALFDCEFILLDPYISLDEYEYNEKGQLISRTTSYASPKENLKDPKTEDPTTESQEIEDPTEDDRQDQREPDSVRLNFDEDGNLIEALHTYGDEIITYIMGSDGFLYEKKD